jgi:hypothetical protein
MSDLSNLDTLLSTLAESDSAVERSAGRILRTVVRNLDAGREDLASRGINRLDRLESTAYTVHIGWATEHAHGLRMDATMSRVIHGLRKLESEDAR